MSKHHYFFAVKLPKEAKEFLYEWIQARKGDFPFARWVHPEDYHITLAFLGFAEKEKLEQAIEKVKPVLEKEVSFTLTLNSIGVFGPQKAPRIFWADVESSEQLFSIQKEVYQQCVETGFQLDKKPFRPHITLARKWNSGDAFDIKTLMQIREENGNTFSFNVTEVVLYETHLDRTPKYVEYANFPLAVPGA
ncbi:RNA 2',3'-cyclic phosphodiesterase [Ureibacillus thermophilus]|uniref:RNA 2',3'-cyclic phosphodiesterase n=1 Tax=Ureibacillus thermophilus TaxID=367743 RepID=UPI001ABFE49A|nr:RNA 2',3'-cyclic phosphodiesterase [Ureibacillus thermophilus]